MIKDKKSQPTILFYISIALIAITIAGTALSFLLEDRINFNGIDEKIFGQFGDFIGGVAGTLINLLAVILLWINYTQQQKDTEETKRLFNLQIGLSVRPDLCFSHTDIFAYPEPNTNTLFYPSIISNEKIAALDSNTYANFQIYLINVGSGAAKNIRYRWIYDLKDVVSFIENNFTLNEIKLEAGKERHFVKIELGDRSSYIPSTTYKDFQDIDVALPFRDDKDRVPISYPHIYMELYLIAIQLSFEQKKHNPFEGIPSFPPAIIELNYFDLAENLHSKHFKFDLKFNNFSFAKTPTELILNGKLIGRETKDFPK